MVQATASSQALISVYLEVMANSTVVTTVFMKYSQTLKIKSVAYSSQGSHTGQLHFCNWLADGSTTG